MKITVSCGILVFIFIVHLIISAFLWPYSINSWLIYAGKESSVVWWQGMLIGCVPIFGQFTIPAAVITWILMLFLV